MPEFIEPCKLVWSESDGVFRAYDDFWLRQCRSKFQDGETYFLTNRISRSDKSHRHYFATVQNAYDNLPDDLQEHYPTPETLREQALLATGNYDQRAFVCSSETEAKALLKFISRNRKGVFYSIKGSVLIERTVHSQSAYSMDTKERFEKSKRDVIGFCADLLGVTADELGNGLMPADQGKAA